MSVQEANDEILILIRSRCRQAALRILGPIWQKFIAVHLLQTFRRQVVAMVCLPGPVVVNRQAIYSEGGRERDTNCILRHVISELETHFSSRPCGW